MKKFIHLTWVFCFVISSCNWGTQKLNEGLKPELQKKQAVKNENDISAKDSAVFMKKPSYQQLYSKDQQWGEIIGRLKHDPSTALKNYNYVLDNGNIARIELYHINNRMVTIENRIYDKNNKHLYLNAFDFDENNNCICNTQWSSKEKRSYSYVMYWCSLVKFDNKYQLFDMNPEEKQQIIQSAKSSLDSIMQHFPEFKYTFNWK